MTGPPMRHQTLLQGAVLILCSVLSFGSNYCYHNPAALKNQLQQHFTDSLTPDEYEMLFNMLYTLYSTPNIVLPFLGGFLVDRVGSQRMLLLLTCLVFLGQSVMAVGSTIYSFQSMLVGRIIFGLGGESLGVARTTFISTWFKKKDLALALGISSSFAGLGGILNNLLSPYFADRFGVSFALWFGAITCAVSVIATAVLVPIDQAAGVATPGFLPNGQPKDLATCRAVRIIDVKQFGSMFWLILAASVSIWGSVIPFQTVAGTMLLERDFFRHPPLECERCGEGNYASYSDCHEIVPSCPAFPPYAWPMPKLSADCEISRPIDQLYCGTSPPYIADNEINCDSSAWKNGIATKLYCEKKIDAEEQATRVMGLTPLISLIGSPVFGYAVGQTLHRGYLTVAASSLVVLSQFLVATTRISIWILLFVQGASSCLYFSTVWPSIPYIVEEHHVGTAYGAIISFGNFVLAILPMIVAAVFRIHETYLPTAQLVLTAVGFIAFLACCGMFALEKRHGRLLNPQTPRTRRLSQTLLLSPGVGNPTKPVYPSNETVRREHDE